MQGCTVVHPLQKRGLLIVTGCNTVQPYARESTNVVLAFGY